MLLGWGWGGQNYRNNNKKNILNSASKCICYHEYNELFIVSVAYLITWSVKALKHEFS